MLLALSVEISNTCKLLACDRQSDASRPSWRDNTHSSNKRSSDCVLKF